MKEKIYILLPVHNRRKITLEFIESLKQQTYENYQLILIDDGSEDGTADAVLNQIPQTVVIKGDGGLWWAGCINKAIDWLVSASIKKNSLVLIINDDTTFNNDFLQQACICLAESPGSLLLARKLDVESDKVQESGLYLDVNKMTFHVAKNTEEINCLSTRGLFLCWADLEKIGKLREKWLPHYGSDMEFTYRAYRKGYKLITDERVFLAHNKNNINFKSSLSDTSSIKTMFSRRYDNNPLMLTKLAMLTSPPNLILQNVFRVWYRTIGQVLK